MTKLNISALKKQKTEDQAVAPAAVGVTSVTQAQSTEVSAQKPVEAPRAKISLAGLGVKVESKPEPVVVPVVAEPVAIAVPEPAVATAEPVAEIVVSEPAKAVEAEPVVQTIVSETASEPVEEKSEESVAPVVSGSKEFFPNLSMTDTEDLFKEFDVGIVTEPEAEEKSEEPELVSFPEPSAEIAEESVPLVMATVAEEPVAESVPLVMETSEPVEMAAIAEEPAILMAEEAPALEAELEALETSATTPAHDAAYVEQVAKELSEKRPGGLKALMGDKKKLRLAAVLCSVIGLSAFGLVFGTKFFGDAKVSAPEAPVATHVPKPRPPKPAPVTATGTTEATGAVAMAQTWSLTSTGSTGTGTALANSGTTLSGSTLALSGSGMATSSGMVALPVSHSGSVVASTGSIAMSQTGSVTTSATTPAPVASSGSIVSPVPAATTVQSASSVPTSQIRTPNVPKPRARPTASTSSGIQK